MNKRKQKLIEELEPISPKWAKKIEKCYFTPTEMTRLGDWGKCVVGEAHHLERKRYTDGLEYDCGICIGSAISLGSSTNICNGVSKYWLDDLSDFVEHWNRAHKKK